MWKLSVEVVCGKVALEFEELGLHHRGNGRRLTNEFGLDYARCQIPLQNHTYEPIGARSGFFLRDVHHRLATIPSRCIVGKKPASCQLSKAEGHYDDPSKLADLGLLGQRQTFGAHPPTTLPSEPVDGVYTTQDQAMVEHRPHE